MSTKVISLYCDRQTLLQEQVKLLYDVTLLDSTIMQAGTLIFVIYLQEM